MKVETTSATPDAALLLARAQVSFHSRVGHLALFLVATGMSVALASLLATEDGLPARTMAGLAVLLAINISWAAYAAWVLAARRTLLFNHRVVAGRIAFAATMVFTLGAAAIGAATGAAAAWLAAGLGIALVAAAIALLARAKRDLAMLQLRRAALEARLSGVAQ
ncbi:MAG: hypothetical protein MT490_14035 [Sphingomonas sp.]|uniref:hypothetical protein n=1 Tax=Sphingomonas sp. TaxID=28214 RepID=UPI00227493E9|nr:hypothetical protein [Sphingomonas sp.]MCX8476908.1 hypothetical protein [Sphingomonas sp.]